MNKKQKIEKLEEKNKEIKNRIIKLEEILELRSGKMINSDFYPYKLYSKSINDNKDKITALYKYLKLEFIKQKNVVNKTN